MAVIRGTALANFHQLVTELGGDSRALVAAAHIPDDDVGRHDRFISLPNGAQMLEDTAAALETPDFYLDAAALNTGTPSQATSLPNQGFVAHTPSCLLMFGPPGDAIGTCPPREGVPLCPAH
ncbi:hypothetical protein VST63_02515 [Mycolicibacterium sp. 050232]|uniref:hypothetical protein n=1 Tax=Mycolicibacterium sp. 050232 TaxID=3113982 RepID=UPI002E2C4195|nr:hypothetical protein [Mycolicibacterium sp. 050232]MED5811222.1 hypothetical protein [Mycolicibacterium sp. 050232]